MQVTRVTIALPKKLWETVKNTVPAGQRSKLVAQALESELNRRKRIEQVGQLRKFQKTMQKKYGLQAPSAGEIEQLRQERSNEQDGLR